tara:strand:- start:3160 stop:3855 length:696 start_codon:yes stop_codon:yes gene_type:complete
MFNIITYKNGKDYVLDYDDEAHSYKVDGFKVPSVTKIVDGCFPKNLTEWALSVGQDQYNFITEQALDIGNETHEWIEQVINRDAETEVWETKIPDTETQHAARCKKAFIDWQFKTKPEWIDSERKIYCDKHRYAGTVDAVARINDRICVIDFKTSKKIYKPYHLQVSAYAQAIKRVDGLKKWPLGIILRLDKQTGEYQQKVFEPKDHFNTFLKCMELKSWSSIRIKEVKIV